MRHMPVPFDIMLENLFDQSHVPFAHSGVAGNRYVSICASPVVSIVLWQAAALAKVMQSA